MNYLLFYLAGWLFLGICYFINDKFVEKNRKPNGLVVYESIKIGLFSWLGVIIGIALLIVGLVAGFDEWLTDKLK